jgi:NAD-dependent SIR2 family protein deacetylase/ADP-ribosylglycohydrolase/protein-tyrosine phosphatase
MNSEYSPILDEAKTKLKTARRIFVLTGAGVSAESGVPTFRGGGGAPVWRGMPFEQLSSAQMVDRDLPLVWEWFDYRRALVSECRPNAAHTILAKVQKSGRFQLFTIATQNIDGLHREAGALEVIELHGSLWRARCLSCKTRQDLREIEPDERPPVCSECFDSMRPDVILFGEAMPVEALSQAQAAAAECDICIVAGTSALVYPAADLPIIAKQAGAVIIEINPEETPLSAQADYSIRGKAGEILPLLFAADRDGDGSHDGGHDPSGTSSPPDSNPASTGASEFKTSESHPIRVDFIESREFLFLKKLGMTFAPGKKQLNAVSGNWNRNLTTDLARLRRNFGVDTLVSLIDDDELESLGLAELAWKCRSEEIELIRFPIRDVSVPTSLQTFTSLIREIVYRVQHEKTVVVHCKGGLGRAGLTAACSIVAVTNGQIQASNALQMVRSARPGTLETAEQVQFLRYFAEFWPLASRQHESLLRQRETAVKEKVLSIGCEGGGADLFRFKADDGKWYFCTSGSSMADLDDGPDISWKTDPVESIAEAIDDFHLCEQIFIFSPGYLNPEFRAEIREYLENLYNSLPLEKRESLREKQYARTPDQWIAYADWRTQQQVERKELKSKKSNKHFLLYWRESSVAAHAHSGHPLDVVSSRQLRRVSPGNTIWVVTINQGGSLVLAGRLRVGEIVDYKTAVKKLNDPDLWDGGYFALPASGNAEYLNPIDMGQVALKLRFKAAGGADRFKLRDGKINPQQMQAMRELTGESAVMLTDIWKILRPESGEIETQSGTKEIENNDLPANPPLKEPAAIIFDTSMNDEPGELNLDPQKLNKFRGCLLGGAVGDAMGAPIEFYPLARIREEFGAAGLSAYDPYENKIGLFTDDTQMTLFTAEGLLRAQTRHSHKGICHSPRIIYHAYMRWLQTQGERIADDSVISFVYNQPSWLRDIPEMNALRAPGSSCLSALRSGKMGTTEEPINNSKGCGGVMRVAPVGLIAIDAFKLACEAAAITHGHPTGYLSAGVLALIIQKIIEGFPLRDAVNHAVYEVLPRHAGYDETFDACDKAIKLASDPTVNSSPEIIESIGKGWIAEEAIAIALYCSLVYESDFERAVLLAVNHSGDSDSTGAITGNIHGALLGETAIPKHWLARLELKNVIAEIAEDLLTGFRTGSEWWNKYPGI